MLINKYEFLRIKNNLSLTKSLEVSMTIQAISYQIPSVNRVGKEKSTITRIYIPQYNMFINNDGTECQEHSVGFNLDKKSHREIQIPQEIMSRVLSLRELEKEEEKHKNVLKDELKLILKS